MDEKLTIVGPEPSVTNMKSSNRKVNIEALLLMAKYNEDFQNKLIENREQALVDSNIEFSKGERTLLKNIKTNTLKEYIENFEIKGITRKSLKNWVCAATVILLISSLLLSCKDPNDDSDDDNPFNTNGITPDTVDIFDPTLGSSPDK